jgi:hypothetical protein
MKRTGVVLFASVALAMTLVVPANAWVQVTYNGYASAMAAAVRPWRCSTTSTLHPCNNVGPLAVAGIKDPADPLDQLFIEPIQVCAVATAPNWQSAQTVKMDAYLYQWKSGRYVLFTQFHESGRVIYGSSTNGCVILGDDFDTGSRTSNGPYKFQNIAPGYFYTAFYSLSWSSTILGNSLGHAHYYFDNAGDMECAQYAVYQGRCSPGIRGDSFLSSRPLPAYQSNGFFNNPTDYLDLH